MPTSDCRFGPTQSRGPLDAADEVLEEANVIRLAAEEQQRFVELMLNPPKPPAALKRAKAAHAKLIG